MNLELGRTLSARPIAHDLGQLGRPVRVVAASTASEVVDGMFRADANLTCIAVTDSNGDAETATTSGAGSGKRWGLVSRSAFMTAMSGRLGYGRALHARRPVGELTDWAALVLPASTPVGKAAKLVLDRDQSRRYSELLITNHQGEVTDPSGLSGPEITCVGVEDVLRTLAAALSRKASTDQLTGLASREHFLDRLASACSNQKRGGGDENGGVLTVVYIDVDSFKAINDGFGHSVGDQALREVARRLRCCLREGDVVARLGGDEFAALLRWPALSQPHPQQHTQQHAVQQGKHWAEQLGERLRACLCRTMDLDGRVLSGAVSIGIAVAAAGAPMDANVLLHEADLAMYRAKAGGGAQTTIVHEVTSHESAEAAPDRRDLARAITNGELVLHYQPIVDVTTGALRTLEALVRWQHPHRGLLAPAAFLADVAAAGFAVDLDAHVLRAALTQQARWWAQHGAGTPPHVNVNVSVPGLLRPDLAALVASELDRAGLPPRALRLELPEVATPAHVRAAAPQLQALRAAGVGLTLDDLGTGAAGLGHLSDLHLDGIKIDRRFVASMLTQERDAAVVRMLVEMAHGLGIAVTAEGAETEEHLQALRSLARGRPTYVQGYAISRPVPADLVPLPWPAASQTTHPVPLRP